MSRRVQLIRHTTGAADAFVGLQGEITVDTTKKELRVHDGLSAGGIPQALQDLSTSPPATTIIDGKLVAADKQKLDFLTLTQAADLDAIEANLIIAEGDIVAIELKTDFITITQSVNLDTLESDVAAAFAELAFITVTQAVNLDTIEIDSNASKIITDFIAITQPVNLDTLESDVVAAVAELAFISVTQAVNLDTMESDIATNNAKVGITVGQASAIVANTAKITNASHTGDMVGSGVLTAQPAIITGKTAIISGIADLDELLLSDAGVLKRVDVKVLHNDLIPIGTLMLFQQTAAPTGWTKQTTHNNKALRVVSGAAGSAGTSPFTTVFGLQATNAHTLTVAQTPAHTHGSGGAHTHPITNARATGAGAGAIDGSATSGTGDAVTVDSDGAHTHTSVGSGSGHSHNIELRVQYVDLIIASKN